MRLRTGLVLFIVLAGAWFVDSAWAQDVAMVVDVQGPAAHYETGPRKGRAVALMDFLEAGDRVALGPGSVVVLNHFGSGLRERITGPGSFAVGKEATLAGPGVVLESSKAVYLPPPGVLGEFETQQSAVALLRDIEPETRVQATSLTRRARTYHRALSVWEAAGVKALAPQGLFDTAVRSTRPLFRWRPGEGVEVYRLRLYDAQGDLILETRTPLCFHRLNRPALRPGERYWWVVLGLEAGRVKARGEGWFWVLSGERLEELKRAEEEIAGRYPEASAEGQIALVLLYEADELYDEAAQVLRGLRLRHPDNQNLARHLERLDPSLSAE